MKARKPDQHQTSRRHERRGRRWLIAAPMVLVALIGIVWLAPAIVSHTFLKHQILSALLSDFEGNVTVRAASLGWLSPVVADDVAIRDRDGQLLGGAESFRSDKSLLALLVDRSRLGRFQIERPTIHLELRQDGSNWQDALSPMLSKPASPATIQQIGIQVIGGEIELLDAAGDAYRVEQVGITVALDDANATQWTVEANAALRGEQFASGEISLEMAWQPRRTNARADAVSGQPSGEGHCALHTQAIPLGPLVASVRQFVGDISIEGAATCDAVYQWKEAANTQTIRIDRLQVRDLSLRAPQWFGDDQLRTAELSGAVRVEADGTQWRVQGLTLDTEFAHLQVQGSIGIGEGAESESWAEVANRLAGEGTRVDGQVDLARLATMLPETLHLRPSTQLQSGVATLWVARESGGTGQWTAGLEATDLAAVDNGVRIQQQHPIRLTAGFQAATDGPRTYQVDCESAFLQATIQGAGAEGRIKIQEADLNKFVAEVGPFVGLHMGQLDGRLAGDVQWLRATEDQISARGNLQLSDFHFAFADDEVWSEDKFSVALAATADVRDGRPTRVLSGTMAVSADGDRLSVELLSPVQTQNVEGSWPVHVLGTGRFARWVPRIAPLRSLLSRHSISLQGNMDLDLTANVTPSSIQADSLSLRVEQFRASGPQWAIDEPVVQFQVQGAWDGEQYVATAQTASLISEAVTLEAQEIAVRMSPADRSIDGVFHCRADLQRVSRVLRRDVANLDQRLAGVLMGDAQITHANGVTQVDWTGKGTDIVYASRPSISTGTAIRKASQRTAFVERWREAVVEFSGRERYDHRQDTLEIERFLAETQAVRLSASGHIQQLASVCSADLTGDIQGDLAALSDRLRPILGPNIQFVGQDACQFAIKGPLTGNWAGASTTAGRQESDGQFVSMTSTSSARHADTSAISPDLQGDASFGWQSANIHGLIVGRGNLAATLEQGVVQFAPLQVPVSEGRFSGRPWIDLREQPFRLCIGKGPLVENVRISPEMCSDWMKYVAPLLSDATRAEGRFSIALDRAKIPLADQAKSDVKGQLVIHSAKVGPGPLAQQILSITRDIKSVIDGRLPGSSASQDMTWLIVPVQTVQFDVRDGRVTHRRLSVYAGDVEITTSGSVGLDESLELVVEVPVRDQWVAGRQYVDALKGTVIKVPVRGTFSQPRIDNRAIRDLSRQMIGGAAGRALQNEVNRGLQQLFGG